jgi:hypothetical protein
LSHWALNNLTAVNTSIGSAMLSKVASSAIKIEMIRCKRNSQFNIGRQFGRARRKNAAFRLSPL